MLMRIVSFLYPQLSFFGTPPPHWSCSGSGKVVAGWEMSGALCQCDNDDREAGDSHHQSKDHQEKSPDRVEGFKGLPTDLEVEDTGEDKQQTAGCG